MNLTPVQNHTKQDHNKEKMCSIKSLFGSKFVLFLCLGVFICLQPLAAQSIGN